MMKQGRADCSASVVVVPASQPAAQPDSFGPVAEAGAVRAYLIICGGIGEGDAPLASCEALDLMTFEWLDNFVPVRVEQNRPAVPEWCTFRAFQSQLADATWCS